MYYVYPCTWLLCERNWHWKHEYERTNMETTIKSVGIAHKGQNKIILVLIFRVLDQYNGNNELVYLVIKSGNFRFTDDEENEQMNVEMTFFHKIISFCENNVPFCYFK